MCSYQRESTKEVDVIQLLPLVHRRVCHSLDRLKCAMVDDKCVDLASKLESKICDFSSVLSLKKQNQYFSVLSLILSCVRTSKSAKSAARYSTCEGYWSFKALSSLSVRATSTTLWDLCSKYCEAARPIPRPAPVTMIVLEAIFFWVLFRRLECVVLVKLEEYEEPSRDLLLTSRAGPRRSGLYNAHILTKSLHPSLMPFGSFSSSSP